MVHVRNHLSHVLALLAKELIDTSSWKRAGRPSAAYCPTNQEILQLALPNENSGPTRHCCYFCYNQSKNLMNSPRNVMTLYGFVTTANCAYSSLQKDVNILCSYALPYTNQCDNRTFYNLRPVYDLIRNTRIHSWTPVEKLRA